MVNLQILQLKVNLQKILKQSNLPIGIIYYVLKDEFKDIETLFYSTLNSLILLQLQQKLKNKEKLELLD